MTSQTLSLLVGGNTGHRPYYLKCRAAEEREPQGRPTMTPEVLFRTGSELT